MNSLTGLRPAVVRKSRHRRAPRSWGVGMVFADDLQHIDQMRRFRAGVDGRRRVDRGGARFRAWGIAVEQLLVSGGVFGGGESPPKYANVGFVGAARYAAGQKEVER